MRGYNTQLIARVLAIAILGSFSFASLPQLVRDGQGGSLGSPIQSVSAQTPQNPPVRRGPLVSTRGKAQEVYERLPDLPKENRYISLETGEVAASNTLVARLIRYHVYVRGRPAFFRLDWKLTLADYLGLNQYVPYETYPGFNQLTVHPLQGDRAAIAALTRTERTALVDTLAVVFLGDPSGRTAEDGNASESPDSSPREDRNDEPSVAPQPGDARLLMP